MNFEINICETVKIINPAQVLKYMKTGIKPIDVFCDYNTDKIVYVFTKQETKELYTKWINYEL